MELEDFFSQDSVQQSGITVWVFLEMMNSGKVTRGIDKSTVSMAIEEVYREIVGDVLKEVGDTSDTRNLCFGPRQARLCVSDCVCVLARVHAGLSVEERPAEEELEGTLVHLKAEQLILLHGGRPQGLPGQHSSGRELLCRGEQHG